MTHVRALLRIALQVAAFALFAAGGGRLVEMLHLPIPGAVAGMVLLLVSLRLRILRPEWFDAGTSFLFRHMLLFFVPAAVGAMQYPQLLGTEGLRVLAVVATSTILVMIATALVVEWAVVRRRAQAWAQAGRSRS